MKILEKLDEILNRYLSLFAEEIVLLEMADVLLEDFRQDESRK